MGNGSYARPADRKAKSFFDAEKSKDLKEFFADEEIEYSWKAAEEANPTLGIKTDCHTPRDSQDDANSCSCGDDKTSCASTCGTNCTCETKEKSEEEQKVIIGDFYKKMKKESTKRLLQNLLSDKFTETQKQIIVLIVQMRNSPKAIAAKNEFDKKLNPSSVIDGEFSEFNQRKVFDFATVYTKSKFNPKEFQDITRIFEIHIVYKNKLKSGIRIGILNPSKNDVEVIVDITEDTVFYSEEGALENNDTTVFELGKNVHYMPVSNPFDLIKHDYKNGDGVQLENHEALRSVVKRYNLNHLLINAEIF